MKRRELQRPAGTTAAALATIALALVIAGMMLMPAPPGAGAISDEVAHLLAFITLAAPLSAVRARFAVFVFVGLCAYGAAIELLQPLVGREAAWSDFGMDVAGALIGASAGMAAGRAWRG